MKKSVFDLHVSRRWKWVTVERFARNHAAGPQKSLKRCRFLRTFRASCGCMHSRFLIKPDFLGAMENYKRGASRGVWGGLIFFSLSYLYSIQFSVSIYLDHSLDFFPSSLGTPLVGLFC